MICRRGISNLMLNARVFTNARPSPGARSLSLREAVFIVHGKGEQYSTLVAKPRWNRMGITELKQMT